jgi:hypothetical protein
VLRNNRTTGAAAAEVNSTNERQAGIWATQTVVITMVAAFCLPALLYIDSPVLLGIYLLLLMPIALTALVIVIKCHYESWAIGKTFQVIIRRFMPWGGTMVLRIKSIMAELIVQTAITIVLGIAVIWLSRNLPMCFCG